MEGGDVYDKQEGGDGRTLRYSDGYGSEMARGPLERQAAGAVSGNYCDRVSSLYRLFTPSSLTLVTHNLSHSVL